MSAASFGEVDAGHDGRLAVDLRCKLRFGLVGTLVERIDPFLAEIRRDPLFTLDLVKSAREDVYVDAVLQRQRDKDDVFA